MEPSDRVRTRTTSSNHLWKCSDAGHNTLEHAVSQKMPGPPTSSSLLKSTAVSITRAKNLGGEARSQAASFMVCSALASGLPSVDRSEKMESRPARLFGCAWRANGREAVMRRTLLKGRRVFIPGKSRPFPQRPKHRVCDITALLL